MCSILTEHHGKIAAAARGAKRSKRRFPGGLQLFDCARFTFVPPRHRFPGANHLHEIYSLNNLIEREVWSGLSGELNRFISASVVIETADVLSHEGDPQGSEMLDPLMRTLRALNTAPTKLACTDLANLFLFFCLRHAGFDPLSAKNHPAHLAEWLNDVSLTDLTIHEHSNSELTNSTFLFLTRSVEEIVGRRYKSTSVSN